MIAAYRIDPTRDTDENSRLEQYCPSLAAGHDSRNVLNLLPWRHRL